MTALELYEYHASIYLSPYLFTYIHNLFIFQVVQCDIFLLKNVQCVNLIYVRGLTVKYVKLPLCA